MNASLAGTQFLVDAVPAVASPSKTKGGRLQVRFSGVPNNSAFSIVIGEKVGSSAPATYADLSNVTTYVPSDFQRYQNQIIVSTDLWSGSAESVSTPNGDSAWTAGRYAFVLLFGELTPSGADEPLATAGPFLIVA